MSKMIRPIVAAACAVAWISCIPAAWGAQLNAVWNGGAGSYNDAGNWSIVDVPLNGGGDTYLVSIDGGNAAASSATLNGNGSVDGLTISAGDLLTIANANGLTILDAAGLTNNGLVSLGSTGAVTTLQFTGVQTIDGSGAIVLGVGSTANRIITNGTVLTNGANHTIRGQGLLLHNTGGMVNDGTIIADQAQALVIDPTGSAFTNNGVMQATGAGGLTLASSTFTNTTTIEAMNGSSVLLNSTTVVGGTLKTSGTGQILNANTNTLDGVMLDGVLSQANATTINVHNGVVNNGTWAMQSTGAVTTLQIVGTNTLGGTGTVILGTGSTANRIITNGAVFTHSADHTIRGQGLLLNNTGGLINNGTIIADQAQALVIDPSAADVVNNSVIQATGAGGLTLVGGTFFNNTTIEALTGSNILLSSATVIGGTLKTNGTALINNANTNTLDGVTLDAELSQTNATTINVHNGVVNNGTWAMQSTGAVTTLQIVGTNTLGGTGTVILGTGSTANRIITNGAVFTHGADHTIRGQGLLLNNTGGLINNGTIIADQAQALVIDPSAADVVNNSVIQATGAGGLTLAAGTYFNNTTIEALTGSNILLSSATVIGGTLKTNGTALINNANTNTLDGVTLDAELSQANATTINVHNGVVNNGTWAMQSTGGVTTLQIVGTNTLGGTGTVVLGTGSTANRIITNGAVFTHGADHTIRGQGLLLNNTGGMINNGTIIADQAQALEIDPTAADVANAGLMWATGAGGLTLNAGTHDNNAGGIIRADTVVTINTSATLNNNPGGILTGTGSFDFVNTGTLNQMGIIRPGNSPGTLMINDDVLNADSAVLEIEIAGSSSGQHDLLIVDGHYDTNGTLNVIFLSGAETLLPTDVITIVDASTVNVTPFDTINALAGGTFDVIYDDTTGDIRLTNFQNVQVVPEPATLGLVMGAMAVLARRRRM